jgi:hypothetical protein
VPRTSFAYPRRTPVLLGGFGVNRSTGLRTAVVMPVTRMNQGGQRGQPERGRAVVVFCRCDSYGVCCPPVPPVVCHNHQDKVGIFISPGLSRKNRDRDPEGVMKREQRDKTR